MTTATRKRLSKTDRLFQLTRRGSSVGSEVRGGIATYMTMVYIVVLNPLIMATQPDKTGHYLGGGTSPNLAGVAVATAVVACFMSILMGVAANYPLAVATGLGLNAFVTYTVVPTMTWPEAMGLIVIEGVVMLVLVCTGFRVAVFNAVPLTLKKAIAAGIGLFITFIGLVDSGIVRVGSGTPVQLGVGGELKGWPTLVFVVGLLVIVVLLVRGVRGGILYGIVGATVLAVILQKALHVGSQTNTSGKLVNPTGWSLNVPAWPTHAISTPDFSTMFHVSFGAFGRVGVVSSVVIIFTMLLSNFFDTMGTMTAVGAEAGLLDKNGTPPNTKSILVVDSLAGVAGGLGGTSSATAYIESASGVGAGARTGLSSIVVGVLFGLSTFLAPLVGLIPYEAATPALIVVGFMMMQQAADIEWKNWELSIPAFLTMVLMPFTYSISNGIGAGFIAYVVIKIAKGKARQVHPLMWVITAAFVVYFALSPVKALFGLG